MKTILLPCGGALQRFASVVRAPNMPTVDLEAALSHLVWTASYQRAALTNIQTAAWEMAFGDTLFNHTEDGEPSQEERQRVYDSAYGLGLALYAKLYEVKAYRDGVFPYAFRGMVDNDTIFLERIRGTATPGHQHGDPQHP